MDKMSQDLINLLCIIHRDGGHYIAEHGEQKAYEDACNKIHNWKARDDALYVFPTITVQITSPKAARHIQATLREIADRIDPDETHVLPGGISINSRASGVFEISSDLVLSVAKT